MTVRREEIGPWLGVLASPRTRAAPGGVPLDDIRLALVSTLLERGPEGADTWLAAWSEAVHASTARVCATLESAAAAAARHSRAPERLARAARPDEDDQRVIGAKIDSAGIPLERAALDPTLPRLGGAAEESWLELERVVATVMAEWQAPIRALAAWRRPMAPLWILTGVLFGLALLVGLMIGGYLPAPAWLQPVTDWWWRLPWP